MSTESTTRQAAPLACTRCRDEDGPFAADGLCEDCTPAGELRSALEDGGHLNEVGTRLMNNYAGSVLRDAADVLRAMPNCEVATEIIDSLAARRTA
jgi:hypothetical protein